MRHRFAVLTVALLALAVLPVTASAVPGSVPAPTVITNLSPVTAAGVLIDGYAITAHFGGIHCETGSEATATAYRCLSKSKVFDPCWVSSDQTYVDCLAQPWAHNVVQLKVTKGYRNYRGALTQKRSFLPWGVQLVDGTKCLILQGGAALIDHQIETYKCPQTKYVLVGDPIKRSKVWRIREAQKVHGGHKMIGKVAIADAWFGKRSRKG